MNNSIFPDTSSETVVWFDLDDTLWDFTYNSEKMLCRVYEHFCLDTLWPTRGEWLDAYHVVNSALWDKYSQGKVTSDELRYERFYRTFVNAGMDSTEADRLATPADIYYLTELGKCEKTVEGAHDVLSSLKVKGYRIGVLSNGFNNIQQAKLTSGGLTGLIDYVVLSDEYGVNKPHPNLFRCAEQVADTTASHCVMIGDNISTDIVGAINAHWPIAVFFNRSGAPLPAEIAEKAKESGTRIVEIGSLYELNGK